MSDITPQFKDVTLLITHYNRSGSLERLLSTFKEQDFQFGGIVVSDDGSRQEHLDKLEKLKDAYTFRLIRASQNKGLGNNINKGQDAVNTAYTLYVQEDFIPKPGFASHLTDALNYMQTDAGLDIARFYSYFSYPVLKAYGKGFSEMIFSSWCLDHLKFYYYSDHPHLRRSNFLEKFGRYPEGIKGDATEFEMALSFIRRKGRGLFYNQFTELFDQENSPDEPSMMNRSSWRQDKNQLILMIRAVYLKYRFLKNSFQLYFKG